MTIKNMDISHGHWYDEKYLNSFFDDMENELYKTKNINKSMVSLATQILSDNLRVEEAKFYRDNDKLILFVVSNVKKFKDVALFEREINGKFDKDNFSFSIIEVLKDEWKDKAVPENWKIDEDMNDKLALYRELYG